MRFMITAVALAALVFASTADAKSCKDAKGHFVKCPAAATASATMAKTTVKTKMKNAGAGTVFTAKTSKTVTCKTGVPCGKSCIPKGKVCHK